MTETTTIPDPMTMQCGAPNCNKDGAWHLANPDRMAECVKAMELVALLRKIDKDRAEWEAVHGTREEQIQKQHERCLFCKGFYNAKNSYCQTPDFISWERAMKLGVKLGHYHHGCDELLAKGEIAPQDRPPPARIVKAVFLWEDDNHYRLICMAEFDNGEIDDVLIWYPDELIFSESEFIGKTRGDVSEMHRRKDYNYLNS